MSRHLLALALLCMPVAAATAVETDQVALDA